MQDIQLILVIINFVFEIILVIINQRLRTENEMLRDKAHKFDILYASTMDFIKRAQEKNNE